MTVPESNDGHRALAGIRVLDFGRYIAAPFCCQLLADMGAEVIHIERPGGEPDRQRGPLHASGQSIYFATLNRNKKGVSLNIRSPQGQAILQQLVAISDVLVHNLSVQRADKLGLGYAAMREANRRLVYLAISGFGNTGPSSHLSAFDAIIQAATGAMTMSGAPDQPPTLSHVPYIDFATGIFGALGITSALLRRAATGLGQSIDQTLYGSAVSMIGSYGVIAEAELNAEARRSVGNSLIYGVGGSYETADGAIVLNCLSDDMWRNLCRTIGRPDLENEPSLQSDVARYGNRGLVDQALQAWLRPQPKDKALQTLAAAGIPAGPIKGPEALPQDPQVQALGLITSIDQPGIGKLPVSTLPIRTGDTPAPIERPAPQVGEHNAEVLGGLLGYSASAIAEMKAQGVI